MLLFKKNFLFLLIPVYIIITSCTPQENFHGISITSVDYESIKIGETPINDFIKIHGEPTFSGVFSKKLYYNYEKTKILPAGKTQILERKIIVLDINNDGIIIDKKLLNKNDGIDINPAIGKTETAGSDFTIFQQIFTNLRSGRFASSE